MPLSPAMTIVSHYSANHETILKFLYRLTDDQLHWQFGSSHPIAWHAWHLARWTDYTAVAFAGMLPELRRLGDNRQIWHVDALASQWGFVAAQLGYAETGMDMDDDIARNLPFPAKVPLLDYVRRAFAWADERATSLTEAELQSVEQPQPLTEGVFGESTIADAILVHLKHDYRHLGMMEALLGLQGQPGTATR